MFADKIDLQKDCFEEKMTWKILFLRKNCLRKFSFAEKNDLEKFVLQKKLTWNNFTDFFQVNFCRKTAAPVTHCYKL